MTSDIFTKRLPGAPRGLFAWEAAGLAWLGSATAAGGAQVVEVLDHDDDRITEVRLGSATPSPQAAEDFSRALAATHTSGAKGFGAAPDGWTGDGFIGTTTLPMPPADALPTSWGGFFAEYRVMPFARTAFDAGDLSRGALTAVERVCRRLSDGEFDDGRPAARIHGDLWSGNVMWTPTGVVLIDPAAHGGHAESDLAMLALFGAPQLGRIGAAWAEAYDATDGWQDRIGLHQLHPVLVHAVLFGGGYGTQAGQLTARYA